MSILDSELVQAHSTEVTQVDGFGLGRIVSFDPRDKKHLMTPPPATQIDIRIRHWTIGAVLNQGDKPHCVAFTMEQLLASSPVRNKHYKTPAELYHACQLVDEWPGEDYDGTSVRAGFKVLRDVGYIESWQNAFELEPVVRHVLTTSPVALGTIWENSMFYPVVIKGEHFIKVDKTSGNAGGHAYLLTGINLDKPCHCGAPGAARITNSWGRGWSDGGKAWICLKELSGLIQEGGEAVCSKELKFTPTTI